MLLEVKNLTKTFGKLTAVDSVNFTMDQNCVCGFVGPNGAGKTTAMRIIAGLESPTAGDVLINGTSAVDYPEKIRGCFGFMPDSFAKYANLTVEEYLDFFAAAYGLRGKEKRSRLASIFDFMNLEDLRGRLSNKLSKGMSQRLGLARTLIHDPDLLILDEPAAGLDPRTRVQVRTLLKILADQGKGVFVSSHILTELSEICDYVTIIEQGAIRASGSVADITKELTPHATLVMTFQHVPADPVLFLLEQPHVLDAKATGLSEDKPTVSVTFAGDEKDQAALLKQLVLADFQVSEFHATAQDLEDLFLSLTDGKVQ